MTFPADASLLTGDAVHGSADRPCDDAGRVEGSGELAAGLVEAGLDLRGEGPDD
ncbi:hypothetical protein [Streptomyces sp. NPDC008121]|uniref:hypothetical protein n=1 Tax=Streptomyces sp. NPDC008121 TaxID=3364809 RepID=UPI0036F0FC34